jgi:hypothetical protein
MAGTVRTRAGLLTEDTNVYINDNTSGDIDPVDHRTSNEDHAASTTNFLDDNFSIDGDGSHKYTLDPTGAWDGTATHDLKFIPKKWLDDTLSTFPTSLENGLNVLGGVGRLGGDLTENTIIDLRDSVAALDRNLEIEYSASNLKLAKFNGDGSWSLGSQASSSSVNQVVIGQNAQTTSSGGIAIGTFANGGSGLTTVAIGDGAEVTGARGISLGYNTSTDTGVSIGESATSTGVSNIAIGLNSSSTGGLGGGIAIGIDSNSSQARSLCIGDSSSVSVDGGIAIGHDALASVGVACIAIGNNAEAKNTNVISIGNNAGSATGTISTNAISIGNAANVGAENIGLRSIAIGSSSHSTNSDSIALGYFAEARATYGMSFGVASRTTATGAIMMGYASSGYADNTVANSFALGWAISGGASPDFLYSKAGQWLVKSLPTFADDASAGVGGVATDEIYKTATGELRIKL